MTPTVMLLVVALVLTTLGCQSAEQRQANELRETLSGLLKDIEAMNSDEIAVLREIKEVVETSRPLRSQWWHLRASAREQALQKSHAASAESAQRAVESTEKRHREAISDLRKEVEEYSDLELAALAVRVRLAKGAAEGSLRLAQQNLEKAKERKQLGEEEARKTEPELEAIMQAKRQGAMKSLLFTVGKSGAQTRIETAPPPDPEAVRQEASEKVAALGALHDQLIGHLKAIQEAQTDVWEKRWAGDQVTMAEMAKRQDMEELRGRLERAGDKVQQLQSVGMRTEVKEIFVRDGINAALAKLKSIESTSAPQ